MAKTKQDTTLNPVGTRRAWDVSRHNQIVRVTIDRREIEHWAAIELPDFIQCRIVARALERGAAQTVRNIANATPVDTGTPCETPSTTSSAPAPEPEPATGDWITRKNGYAYQSPVGLRVEAGIPERRPKSLHLQA